VAENSVGYRLSGDAAAQPPEPHPVAARVLAELLALDLGNLTPLRALTLLHDMQSAAREALPWRAWVAELARSPETVVDGVGDRTDADRR
jgi:hypothetical protein